MRLLDVAGPNACCQSIVGPVGARDYLLHIFEGNHAHDGPEDFFPGDCHVVLYVGEDGWLNEVATISNALASAGKCRPLVPPRFDIAHDSIELGRFQLEHWVEASEQAMSARNAIGENRFHDIYQQQLETQPVETVEGIYDFLGLELTDLVRSEMQRWSAQNQKGSRGQHHYTTEEFGYDAETIRLAFSDYMERFRDVTLS